MFWTAWFYSWKHYYLPKYQELFKSHQSFTFHKTWIFSNVTLRTSHPVYFHPFYVLKIYSSNINDNVISYWCLILPSDLFICGGFLGISFCRVQNCDLLHCEVIVVFSGQCQAPEECNLTWFPDKIMYASVIFFYTFLGPLNQMR